MDYAYTANELFHLVGRAHPDDNEANYETIKSILSSGHITHSGHRTSQKSIGYTIHWDGTFLGEDFIDPTITCFADIPFDSLGVHIKKYGRFGISFPKNYMVKMGARPVIYVPVIRREAWKSIHGSAMLKNIEEAYKGFRELIVEEYLQD